jgi:LCP family protein required for cell wall assembly
MSRHQPPNRIAWLVLIIISLFLAACAAAAASSGTLVTPTVSGPSTVVAISEPTPTNDSAASPPQLTETQPRATLVATSTPTAQPKGQPTLGYYNITPLPNATLVTPFPTPVSAIVLDEGLVNILLIGSDWRASDNSFRTDTLIVVSINKASGLVTMLSIPRDLFVYVPTWGMQRINKAYADGESSQYPGGGANLLAQTLLYNLGVPIHYYALVNFDGFRQIVDTLGGIEVPVTCQLTEYKIKDPALDEADPDNYELYTQPAGVGHMDGALALWYARARPVGGDFYRSYRQRQVLRAIYHTALDADVIPRLPELYGDFQDVVQSDLGLWDVMQFAPLAAKLDDTRIRSLHIGPNQTASWVTPRGEDVLLPRPEAMRAFLNEAFSVSENPNQLERPWTRVEIWNATANADWERLAAETLANEGFAPVFGAPDTTDNPTTQLIDYTTSPKGSPLKSLQSILHIADENVIAQPDSTSPVQFRVVLGSDYNACPRLYWMDPGREATPTPTP